LYQIARVNKYFYNYRSLSTNAKPANKYINTHWTLRALTHTVCVTQLFTICCKNKTTPVNVYFCIDHCQLMQNWTKNT